MSIDELAIDSADAILAGRLPWPHKDPFDRVIVAQALHRNLTIATRDTQMVGAALTAVLEA
ncbi:PIN domain-containing protein [Mycolicibacterium sp.]|uniref:PIN domain-containing protein n=1 Tax=Mycolicibacterium sp. TaxID=2320850 RepID=UPI0028B1D6A5|nr:PIN domain-containing protein [Mycolicibacterium sp.]